MPSRNIGRKRDTGRDTEIPAELSKREAQDRAKGATAKGRAQSRVDAQHVDAPRPQDDARVHQQRKGR